MSLGDVDAFHRYARAYDYLMIPADPDPIERGLAVADRPVERVLDVGGGTGRVSRVLDAETIVVDAARGMCSAARERADAVVQGDARALPFADASADAVVVVDALHHMADIGDVFAAVHRVLRPGGVCVVREFDPSTLRGRGLVIGERLVGFDSQFYTPAAVRERLQRAGFDATVTDRGFTYTVAGVA
jgi:demethylmenaquinone methyltransferase/2-methoxy-6-polyprenyl-1,4-benzoquinol methylase